MLPTERSFVIIMRNPAQSLLDYGTSIWYDNISRDLLLSGELKHLVNECGVRGLTSNPTIFEKAVSGSTVYNESIKELKASGLSSSQIFEELALKDIAQAADILLPVFESSNGIDGYVSIEVSPIYAFDADSTLNEARRLFSRLERKNIMIKIPGTKESMPAIQAALEDGINVNVTLLFSVENYEQVAKIYCNALKNRLLKGLSVSNIASVASFFVSRVDSAIDLKLDKIDTSVAKQLKGQFAIANSKLAYAKYQEIFEGVEFNELKNNGAKVQRPLWASTGVKNPAYRDVRYVEELIGPNTVNTMPHETLESFIDHGTLGVTITKEVEQAIKLKNNLEALGINIFETLLELQSVGVSKFIESFEILNKTIEAK